MFIATPIPAMTVVNRHQEPISTAAIHRRSVPRETNGGETESTWRVSREGQGGVAPGRSDSAGSPFQSGPLPNGRLRSGRDDTNNSDYRDRHHERQTEVHRPAAHPE